MRIAKLDSIVQKWIVEFESVGLSFFKEMNDYEKLEEVLDIYNVSGCPALSVWTGERILHGICLHYICLLYTSEKTRLRLLTFTFDKLKVSRLQVTG